MTFRKCLLLTLLTLGFASFLGCARPEPVQPLSEQEKNKINADMEKASKQNKTAIEKKDKK